MIDVDLLVEDSRWAGELLVEVCFVDHAMVHNGNHIHIVEDQIIRSTPHDRALKQRASSVSWSTCVGRVEVVKYRISDEGYGTNVLPYRSRRCRTGTRMW